MSNTALWDKLGKTDPKHTKDFKRSGGFSGTALKPMWVWKMLTEEFGPFGVGWGCNEPKFQVVPTDKEILVYCTVSGWHGSQDNLLWGVGGDKVAVARSSGVFTDDEAFKKAFTDALMNAFKFVGVGADIHMGLFDDSKYVASLKREFAEQDEAPKGPAPAAQLAADELRQAKTADEFKHVWNSQKEGLRKTLNDGDYAHVVKVMQTEAQRFVEEPKDTATPFDGEPG